MRAVAVVLFLAGLLLAVRVMFFGVQRRLDEERLAHRAWPLALAALLVVAGAMLYSRSTGSAGVTGNWLTLVVLVGIGAGAGAWWLVKRSAAVSSTDPEDDPRYRFQGHIARVTEPFESRPGGAPTGRIAFNFDGKRYELRAFWSLEGDWNRQGAGLRNTEVVIERVEGEVAYVEPWTVVEQRL